MNFFLYIWVFKLSPLLVLEVTQTSCNITPSSLQCLIIASLVFEYPNTLATPFASKYSLLFLTITNLNIVLFPKQVIYIAI